MGIWGCKRAGLQAGDDVLVTGAGPVGLLAAAAARAFGAGCGDGHRRVRRSGSGLGA